MAISLPIYSVNPIRGELWISVNLLEGHQPGTQLPDQNDLLEKEYATVDEMLEDARWIFSGMIYGFDVRWIPLSRARAIDEVLEITPAALIPRGDPGLKIISITQEEDLFYFLLEYSPDANQSLRIKAWQGHGYPVSRGIGLGTTFEPVPRRVALEQAIKNSLYSWLRVREFNKPREILGRLAFIDFPIVSIYLNNLRASVIVSMDFESVNAYTID